MKRDTARLVRETIETELAKALKPLGVRINHVHIKFGDTGCTAVVDIRDGVSEKERKEVDLAIFSSMCWAFGLTSGDYGRFFRSGGKLYRLVGLNSRPKYCVVGEQLETKKQYLFTRDVLRDMMPLYDLKSSTVTPAPKDRLK